MLTPGARVVGQQVRQLPMPPDTVLPMIIRNGQVIVPGRLPEPASLALVGIAALAGASAARRRRQA